MYIIFTRNSDKMPFQVMMDQTVASARPLLGAHWDQSQEERCMKMIILRSITL
jgi:hypothetical protein